MAFGIVRLCVVSLMILTQTVSVSPLQSVKAQGQPQSTSNRLVRVMAADMLNVQIRYLESITGPARRVTPRFGSPGQERQYQINGCELTAIAVGTQVTAYRLRLSPTCTFEIRRMVPNFRAQISANQVTFGMLAVSFSPQYAPSCLSGCGNAADPQFSMHGEGSRADGNIEIVATAIHNNSQVSAAVERLHSAARRLMSDDAIMDGRFNCHARYQELSAQAFRDVRLQEITIGYGLSLEQQRC